MGATHAIPSRVHYLDIEGPVLRQYYAAFCRRALPEDALGRLSDASRRLDKHHIGYQAWLTMVAGADCFLPKLQEWSIALGDAIAPMKPRLKHNARAYVPSYDHKWGRQASIDGAIYALRGKTYAPPYSAQAEALGCHRDAYLRIRNFVAGSLMVAASQFETELVIVTREDRYH